MLPAAIVPNQSDYTVREIDQNPPEFIKREASFICFPSAQDWIPSLPYGAAGWESTELPGSTYFLITIF
jgi:hypothetical protein